MPVDDLTVIFDFNPRSPWGERQTSCWDDLSVLEFQSTLPVGGATLGRLANAQLRY